MKGITLLMAALCLCSICTDLSAQNYTQTIRGKVVDQISQTPLLGATIKVSTVDPVKGASTDLQGDFSIKEVPTGRHDIEINYLGYQTRFMRGVMLKSGKELVLNIGLEESFEVLKEVVISAEDQLDKSKAQNEFSTLSARTFSVEETNRYAATAYDPARMALNYAGVASGATDDLSNEIVVRGNSPSGVLWRLEGIEIPNPNHFGELGSSGGGISMLSSSTLGNSDFYTGAFPSEIGNATSAAFDLKLRNGNNKKREYAFMLGVLGIEAAAEGPFQKGKKASYLFNYRYATLGILQKLGLSPTGDVLPTYSDLSFKLNFPTQKAGTFSIFGLGGSNIAEATPVADKTEWDYDEDDNPEEGFDQLSSNYNLGLSHKYLIDENSYLHTVALYSKEDYNDEQYLLDTLQNYKRIDDYKDNSQQTTLRGSIAYTRKFDQRSSIRLGAVLSSQDMEFKSENRVDSLDKLLTNYNNQATGGLFQIFGQWKYRLTEDLLLNTGLHFSKLTFNNQSSIEPRISLQWQATPKSKLSISSGLHSKMEHLGYYFFEGTSFDGEKVSDKSELGLPKSWHNVLGFDHSINEKTRIKVEAYHQHLYDIAESADANSVYSTINASEIWDYIGLPIANETGIGRNIGVDLTFERAYSGGSYYMLTGSVYDSKFKAPNGKWYNTQYNGNYMVNLVGGKEWALGKSNKKKKSFGVNGRLVVAGGRRVTPLDIEASKELGEAILDFDKLFSEQGDTYMRLDVGINYTFHRSKSTHSIRLDVQNATNRENVYGFDYNDSTLEKSVETQTGLFPFFNYRIEF